MGMGGTETAWAATPLGAMAANPAGLGFQVKPEGNIGVFGGVADGHFQKGTVSSGGLDSSFQAIPEAAFAWPLHDLPVTLGLSFVPQSTMFADWKYPDPPGGLGGVSYGLQRDHSEILVLRSAFGAGVRVSSKLSFGVSAGLIYNENRLQTPYIFQNMDVNPGLNGAKTLLNLHTSGFGWDIQIGALFKATTNLQFGLSYKTESTVDTSGKASGDAYAQFASAPGGLYVFQYDANVRNTFPQEVSTGMSWQFHPQWRLALQVDWLNWGDAFDTLPVSLKNGSNPGINGALGSAFKDRIPLKWSDQFVYRAGLEYDVTKSLALRVGYAYGQSPVPNATLSPMTAVIMEHTFTAGVGYEWRHFGLDLAYQYDLPVERHVGTSGLLSGEYSNSSTSVSLHWIALTARIKF